MVTTNFEQSSNLKVIKNMQLKTNDRSLDDPYLYLLEKVDFTPIFILGDHRSGTTILHQILAATECFNFLRAAQIINYDRILFDRLNGTEEQTRQDLNNLFQSLGIGERYIDKVTVAPDLPEEYGFILKNAGYDSHLTSESLFLFVRLCKKIQFLSHPEKPILLKNPLCFPHFKTIKTFIPQAKFIFIHRHPLHVMSSKLKAVRLALSMKSSYLELISKEYGQIFNNPIRRLLVRILYSSFFGLGLHRVTEQSIRVTTAFLDNISSLSTADYLSIKYDDLCIAPEETITKVLEFLGLEARATIDYESWIASRPLNLLPEVRKNYDDLCGKLELYLTYYREQI
ncbi:MAG: sulfotransferase [Okeania sp. SIO2H7]|nr:sulfotransferase [Okeania sp. SIO2H7]